MKKSTKHSSNLVNELSGLFVSTLWDSIILQESNEEEFVRDTITAIGALFSSEKRTIHDPTQGRLTTFALTPRYQFALQQYGRAVKTMREKLTGRENNLRKALVGCLLVICFESLQKNYVAALTHSISGCALLQDWLNSRYNESSYTLDASKKDGITSPAKNIVEDELVQAFARHDLQLMSFIDPRPPKIHQNLLAGGQSTIDNMPKSFASIDEARIHLELIQRRNSRLVMVFSAYTASCTFYTESHFSVSIAGPGHPNFWLEGIEE
jgi:hypothetical protein